MPLHEDRVGSVHHDLPDIVVIEQPLEGSVSSEVAERPLDHRLGIREVERTEAALVIDRPAVNLVLDERPQFRFGLATRQVKRDVLRADLDRKLDLDQRIWVVGAHWPAAS